MTATPAETPESAGAWVAGREPRPPAVLAARVAAHLGRAPVADRDATVERCLAAAEHVVAGLLAGGSTARDSALDLLAADALATYAFELASDGPESLGRVADAAMARFAALGLARGAAGPAA